MKRKVKRVMGAAMVIGLIGSLIFAEKLFSKPPGDAVEEGTVRIEKIKPKPENPKSVPLRLNYQGYLTDNSGSPVNDSLPFVFKIFDASTGGTELWSSNAINLNVQNGIFHVILPNVPDSVFSSGLTRWLEITVNGEVLSPRTEITSMAYAYNTYMIGGKPVSDVSPSTGQVLKWNGSQWAPGDDNAGADSDWVISGSNMYSGVSGNVGIGTTNPGRLLSLESDTISPTISFNNIGPGGREWWIFSSQDADGAGGGKLVFRDQTANSVRAVIDSTGNVGIGVTSPDYPLTVHSTNDKYSIYAENTYASSAATGIYGYANPGGNYDAVGVQGECAPADGYGYGGFFRGGHIGLSGNVSPTGSDFYCGVEGYATGGSGTNWGVYGQANGSGTNYGVYGYIGLSGSGYAVYAEGDFGASGTKSAVVRTSKGPTELYAMESPEVWFEDFGSGHLINGRAHIELDPLFLETVTIDDENPMKVFITLTDECNGVYVKKGTTGFDVIEINNGNSNATFDYRVIAKRKGYEERRMKVNEAGYIDEHLYPDVNEIPAKYREARLAEMKKRVMKKNQ